MERSARYPSALSVVPWLFIMSPAILFLIGLSVWFASATTIRSHVVMTLRLGDFSEAVVFYATPLLFVGGLVALITPYFSMLVSALGFIKRQRWGKIVLELYCAHWGVHTCPK